MRGMRREAVPQRRIRTQRPSGNKELGRSYSLPAQGEPAYQAW